MTALELQLPPGFRFHPTDEELVMHYLCRKCASQPIAVPIIADIDLYKFDPWQLPEMALYGEKKWYFFSPRDRKYPNGSRPNRAAGTGYWKATGADKPVGHPKPLGIKKALVFYAGKAPRGEKTNWIMHEYRLADVDRSVRRKNSLRLDDWVLCCIYNKKGTMERHVPGISQLNCSPTASDRKPSPETLKLPPMGPAMAPPPPPPPPATPPMGTLTTNNYVYFDTSDSVPKIHTTDSSCSEQVMSPDMEVQSEPKWNPSWEAPIRFPSNYDGTVAAAPLPPPTTTISAAAGYDARFVSSGNQMSPLQDMFMYLQKPF